MSNENFYVTTPIYYVNSVPHLGHAYTTILADVVNRYQKLIGNKTFFQTGTDEHGDKIAKAAGVQDISPQELTDINSKRFKDLLPIIGATNDSFIRTTDKIHKKVVSDLLQRVYDKGDIYKADYEGKYCYGCERYLGDDELKDGRCIDHDKEPELIKESNYFFKMTKYWDELKSIIDARPELIVPVGYRKEVKGLLAQNPTDLCISRPKSRLEWGIELPFDKDFVTYVWFDALINYVSGIGYPDSIGFDDKWNNSHHVIAKDILKPHCIYWPTMLLSMGIPLPKQVAIHGYWLIDDSKMSKSRGRVVDPVEYCEKYSRDVFRYYLMRGMRFGRDSSFSFDSFKDLVNAELSNNLGNLYSRVVGMCKKNTEGLVPSEVNYQGVDRDLLDISKNLLEKTKSHIDSWQIDDYIGELIQFCDSINKYINEMKPWALSKDPGNTERINTILRTALEGIRICLTWLTPVIPDKSKIILEGMGVNCDPENLMDSLKNQFFLHGNHSLPLKVEGFPRIE